MAATVAFGPSHPQLATSSAPLANHAQRTALNPLLLSIRKKELAMSYAALLCRLLLRPADPSEPSRLLCEGTEHNRTTNNKRLGTVPQHERSSDMDWSICSLGSGTWVELTRLCQSTWGKWPFPAHKGQSTKTHKGEDPARDPSQGCPRRGGADPATRPVCS